MFPSSLGSPVCRTQVCLGVKAPMLPPEETLSSGNILFIISRGARRTTDPDLRPEDKLRGLEEPRELALKSRGVYVPGMCV